MKNKIPKSVNIFGHIWRISLVNPLEIEGVAGVCEYPIRVIRLSKDYGGLMLQLNFLHELKHAAQFETGLTQLLGTQALEQDAELFVSLVTSLQKQKII